MLKPTLSKKWKIAGGVAAAVVVLLVAAAWRLSAGPVRVDWLKPSVEHAVAGAVKGGRARLDAVSLAWFPEDQSLGLRLEGLHLTDARGRTVAEARRLDAGIAADALAGLHVAPGRFAADHFFAAVSVSPEGRYGLGYEPAVATGKRGAPLDIGRLFLALTGKPKLGRQFGFLRTVQLTDGRIALRQIGGGPAWTADVRRLSFHKGATRLAADVDIAVAGRDRPATLNVAAGGAVGMSHAWVRADVENLRPAALFPSVGPTARFAALDAPVQGRATLAYDFHSGFNNANLRVTAGAGTLDLGRGVQAFKSAEIAANYAPKTGEVVMSAFKMEAERSRLDLTGAFRLTPEDAARKVPAKLEYRISGPRFVWRLAEDAPPQDLYDVNFRGRLIPQAKRFEIDQATATIAGAPFSAHGVFFRDAHDQLGAQLMARVSAPVGPDQIFAFWPETFASGTRGFLHRAILGGRFTGASFRMDAHPGHMRSEGLDDEEMNLRFGFENGGFQFASEFPAITDGRGQAVLQGNRFDLALDSGRMGDVELSQGSVEMPTFRVHGAVATYRFVARGPVRDLLAAIDGPKLHLISGAGFDRNRTSGQAAVKVVVRRPMLFQVPKEDLRVDYEGVIEQGGLTQAALGWDLTDAALKLKGDEKRFSLIGKGVSGPYKGDLEFRCDFGGVGPHGELLLLDGAIDAAILGGGEGRWSPFAGRFNIAGGAGSGMVRAAVFNGHVAWRDGDGPDRFVMFGWGDTEGLRRAGTPLATGLPDHFLTQVRFDRTGDMWRGPVKADIYSGSVAFAAGQRPRLVYETDLTPQKARRLGLADIPYFQTQRRVVVDSIWAGTEGSADVRSGGLDLQLGWGRGEHRARASLTPQDLAALGLPSLSLGNTPVLVDATWKGGGDRISGFGQAADTAFKFLTAPAAGGGETLWASTELDGADLKRLGLPAQFHVEGKTGVLVRMNTSDRVSPAGRIEVDLSRADLSVEGSDWRKPSGRPGRASIDFAKDASGVIRLTHVSAQADNLDLDGSATLTGGKLTSADFDRLRLTGLFDASVKAARDLGSGEMNITVRGRQFDARRWFGRSGQARAAQAQAGRGGDKASAPPGLRAPEPAPDSVRIDAAFDQVRLTDDTQVQDLRLNGVWGAPQVTRLDISAQTINGGRFKGRLFPQNGFVAVAADTTDAGEVAKGLFGVKDLKGGHANITGKLVEGGADLNVEVHDVRVVHAPAMAQLLTVASFKGLADTLNGEGVLFTRVVAPVQIRGSRLVLGDARATGQALGITAQGVADIEAGKLEIHGTLAPAYALNSAVGQVPVLGQILTSRKGEGFVGLGYYAKGSIDKPQVMVNPLSLVTPGILRRMFEGSGAPPSVGAQRMAGGQTGGE